MLLKLFGFQEHFTINVFLIKLKQFEKTESISELLNPLGNLIVNFDDFLNL